MNKYGIVIFAAVLAFVSADIIKKATAEEKTEFQTVHKKCQDDKATFVDEALIKKLFEGVFTEDAQLKVHMLCMFKGFKTVKPNGQLDKDVIQKKWSAHYNGEHLNKLQSCLVEKSTPEETSWALLKCENGIVGSLYSR